jgi:phosphoserine phosphatase
MFMQFRFLIDLLRQKYPAHPFTATVTALEGWLDLVNLEKLFQDFETSFHVRIPIDEYKQEIRSWLAREKHPRFGLPYTRLVYRPMLELIDFLGKNDFKAYIVSGAGIEFSRIFWEEVLQQTGRQNLVPREQIIGSTLRTDFEIRNGKPIFTLLPWPEFVDNGKRKAVSINEFVNGQPIAAFGNSNGDIEMLEYTGAGDGERLTLLIDHTDDQREYAYQHKAREALAMAPARGWIVVDMKRDWNDLGW